MADEKKNKLAPGTCIIKVLKTKRVVCVGLEVGIRLARRGEAEVVDPGDQNPAIFEPKPKK